MIDHVSVPVADLKRSIEFYTAVLEPLGMVLIAERARTVGFGKKYPEFWLNARAGLKPAPEDDGHHVCLRAPTQQAVIAFHEAALASGGFDYGEPGDRQGEMTTYFGAFIRDPDGNKIEVLTIPRE